METTENRVLLRKLWIVAVGMFGFGFLMVPFYNKICEVTGINSGDAQVLAKNTQVDTSRTVTLEFDANVDAKLPWKFTPVQKSISMHPGEMVHVLYEVENQTDQDITGQADTLSLARMIAGYVGRPLHYELVDFHSSRPGHDLRYALDGGKMRKLGWEPPNTIEQTLKGEVDWYLRNPGWL